MMFHLTTKTAAVHNAGGFTRIRTACFARVSAMSIA
jgi:hypothetical protein